MRIILVVISLFSCVYIQAQKEILDRHLSLHYTNKPLVDILKEIADLSEIEFAFGSDLIPSEELVTIDIVNGTVNTTLHKVFKAYNIEFRLIAGAVVIYQTKKTTSIYKEKPKPIAKLNVKKVPPVVDTIVPDNKIETEEETSAEKEEEDDESIILKRTLNILPFVGLMDDNVYTKTEVKGFESSYQFDPLSYGVQVDVQFSKNRIAWGIGAAIYNFNEHHSFYDFDTNNISTVSSNSYYKVDTLTSYVEILPTGINIVVITDSTLITEYDTTWSEVVNKENVVNSSSRYTYLSLPMSGSFTVLNYKRIDLNLRSTLAPFLLLNTSSKEDQNYVDVYSKRKTFTQFGIAYNLGANLQYQLTKPIALVLAISHRGSFTAYNTILNKKQRSQQLAFSAGLSCKF